MRKSILPVLLSLCGILSVYAVDNTLPLTAPPAPFVQESAEKTQGFNPEIKGSEIVSGNKKIEMRKDGQITLSADGKVLAKGYLLFYMESSAPKEYLRFNDTKWFKTAFKTDGGKLICDGEFSHAGMTGNCRQTIELLENGLIMFDADASFIAKQGTKIFLSSFWFEMDYSKTLGQKLRNQGKDYVIPEKEGDKLSHWDFMALHNPRTEIEFFHDNPRESFAVIPGETCQDTRFYYTDWSKTYNFRLFPGTGSNHISFLLDIKNAVSAKAADNVCAGIDFKAVDGLALPDFKSSKNLIQNPSFEQGLESYFQDWNTFRFTGREIWSLVPFAIDKTVSKFGSQSMRILAMVKKNGDYRSIGYPFRTFPVPLEAGKYTFSFYAKSEPHDDQRISIWLPNSCWVGYGNKHLPIGFQRDGKGKEARAIFNASPDWERYSLSFEVPQSMPVSVSIGADSTSGGSHVWIDGLQLEKDSAATDFKARAAEGLLLTSGDGNFLQPSDRMEARLEITARPERSGKVTVSVKNFFDEELFSKTFKFKCGSDGKALVQLPFDGNFPCGIFVAKAEYELDDGSRTYDFHRFSIMNFLENKHRLKNIFSENYGDSDACRYDFFKILDRYRKIGIGAKSHTYMWDKIIWDSYQKYGIEITNSFMFSFTWDQQTDKMQGFCIRSSPGSYRMPPDDPDILIKDYNTGAGGEITVEWLEKFKEKTAEVAKKHPWIPMWAAGGEVFAKFPVAWWSKDGTPETASKNFAKVLKAFYQGVKEGNPAAKVFQDDPCNMSPDGGIAETDHLLAEVNKLGGVKFDMIGIHTYRNRPESPDLDADTQTLFKVLEKNGYGNTPVFWPEGMHYGPYTIPQWGIESARWLPPGAWYYGALSYDMGWTEKISAAWRARSWLVALKYQDRVKSFLSGAHINNFEMDMNMTPYATQKISNTLGHLLGDAYFRKDVRFAPYIRAYIFEDAQKRPVAAVWCHHPKLDAGIMPAPMAWTNFNGSLEQIFDLMECERSFKPDVKGNVKFPVSSFPLFFRGKPGTLDVFVKAFETVSLSSGDDISPLAFSSKPSAPETAVIAAKNYLSRTFDGTLELAGQKIPLHVPGSGVSDIFIKLPVPLTQDGITQEKLNAAIKSESCVFASDLSFSGFVCKKAKTPITIDGNPDDWKEIPAVKFENRYIADKKLKNISDKDFSGWLKTAWDEKGIYICVKITDDKFVHEAFTKQAERWCNDCLQIYFDSLCNARSKQQTGYDEDDYDYAVYPNPDGRSSLVFRNRTPDPQLGLATQAPKDSTAAADIPSAFRQTEDGYVYEVFFPAKYLLPARLEKGSAIGFGIYAADCDDASLKYPNRVKSALTVSPVGSSCYNSPHQWPAMLLWE